MILGAGIYVSDTTPLHVSINGNTHEERQICFLSNYSYPYDNLQKEKTSLSYTMCVENNVRNIYEKMKERYIKSPIGVPDLDMFNTLIWSTWVRYKADVTQEKVLTFAKEILDHGFTGSCIAFNVTVENNIPTKLYSN